MKSRTTSRFRQLLAALPAHVRRQAREAYKLFEQDPSHPGLRFKRVYGDPPIFSARVGLGYRAVGTMSQDSIVWYWIGSHADYDTLLAQL